MGKDVNGQPVLGHTGLPFARFLIFGPNGDLLPSVNLDGNGEKFVPGACVACHGGRNYFALASDPPFNLPAASNPSLAAFPRTAPVATIFSPTFSLSTSTTSHSIVRIIPSRKMMSKTRYFS